MKDTADLQIEQPTPKTGRDWVKVLSAYREPNQTRSFFELAVTAVPFVALWALAWLSMSVSLWLTFAIALVNALFLLRLFTIQHDCGHGAFFKQRALSDWVGRVLGVLTLTPYDVWRRSHAIHHGAAGNLDRRGMGDVMTLTVDEFSARSWFAKLKYRLYRNPIVLFGFGPGYLFLFQNRLPLGLTNQVKYWVSAMGTNAAIAAALGLIWYFGGLNALLLIFLPTTLLAATGGVWLFYVQHQFEETHWSHEPEWQLHDAALAGSSHYVMPKILQWFSANIGIHHVHHLYSRIPFYRLTEVLRDHGELAEANRLTIPESFACARLHLWDEKRKELLSFRQARKIYG